MSDFCKNRNGSPYTTVWRTSSASVSSSTEPLFYLIFRISKFIGSYIICRGILMLNCMIMIHLIMHSYTSCICYGSLSSITCASHYPPTRVVAKKPRLFLPAGVGIILRFFVTARATEHVISPGMSSHRVCHPPTGMSSPSGHIIPS